MAADTFQIKRGSTAAVNAYLPAVGEPVYDITVKQLKIGDGITMGGVATANAGSADKLTTPRNISVSGMLIGTTSFDGSADVSINTVVAAPLQALLDAKANLASPALTGTPTAPTASPGTNTTQVATTAYATAADAVLTTAINLKANIASPSLTGVPLSTTPAVGTNTTQIATASMVQSEIANKRVWTAYTPTVTANTGTYTTASATGSSMVAFGICNFRIKVTITTKGTGSLCIVTLPFNALAGSAGMPMIAKGSAVNFVTGSAVIGVGLNTLLLTDYLGGDIISANGVVVDIAGSYPIA